MNCSHIYTITVGGKASERHADGCSIEEVAGGYRESNGGRLHADHLSASSGFSSVKSFDPWVTSLCPVYIAVEKKGAR